MGRMGKLKSTPLQVQINARVRLTCNWKTKHNTKNSPFTRTRIECSRVSTQELSDHVRLKYEYETKLDLEDNSLEIDALYSPDVNTKGVCNDDQYPDQAACTGAGNTWTPTYSVSSSFGTCDITNNFVTVSGCSNVQFENDPGNNKLVLRTTKIH